MQRKINWLLVLFSLIGGAVGFVIGEVLLGQLFGRMPGILLIGLYFGILALSIGLFCLIAEVISPRLNGLSWRQRYMGTSWKLLVPATLVMLLLAGTAFEFIYELNVGRAKTVKDIVLIIDNSGSMMETDPDDLRYEAAKSFVDQMDSSKQVAVIVFNDQPELIQPFVRVRDQGVKNEVHAAIDALEATNFGTDIALALELGMEQIKGLDSARGAMAILLSDGFSDVNTAEVLADYRGRGVVVNTVGLGLGRYGNSEGASLLKDIASQTGGRYYDEADAANLSVVFRHIYDNLDERTLVTERTGLMEHSVYYTILRIVLVLVLGALLGLSLGLMFDNRFLARSFTIGGAVSGLLAGLLLEYGLDGSPVGDAMIRLLACLILAAVMTMFSVIVPMRENEVRTGIRRRGASVPNAAAGYTEPARDRRSRGF
ncbi:vWA domain-containing protein [Paenibacillus lentus]|uniref:VWA domain-containing protein n=1 Tax=Paenibacillus lentus TaxID=1338368 RepID=A0A3Q8S3G4_9BACL|nr:vWA domain-containing protein [Paenibacillus lentus]AZK44995.1 VWA domain-containing protein [Paenibacillus lentus]